MASAPAKAAPPDRPFRFQHRPGHGTHTHIHPNGEKERSSAGYTLRVADPKELDGVMSKFIALDPPKEPETYQHAELELVKRGSRGPWFNVVRKDTGKPINDKALTEDDALELMRTWTSASASGTDSAPPTDPPGQLPGVGGAPAEAQNADTPPNPQ